ncbi:MAG: helix-turn-helix transcriptional regulator [Bacilli bacterium]
MPGAKTCLLKKGAGPMRVNYDKLWKLARDNKMNCRALSQAADVSANTVTKLGKNELVSMDVMLRLCKIFHCDIGDLMEVIEDTDS